MKIEKLNEGNSLTRMYQHLNKDDKTTFAIIGSNDKDNVKISHAKKLYDLIREIVDDVARRASYKPLIGTYQMEDGEIITERSYVIYNITKEEAISIGVEINQESIIWKDTNFFGFIYMDDREENCFSRTELDFSVETLDKFASKLLSKHNEGKRFAFKFEEEYIDDNVKSWQRLKAKPKYKTIFEYDNFPKKGEVKIEKLLGDNGNAYSASKYLYHQIKVTDENTIVKSDNLTEGITLQFADDKHGGVIILSTDVNAVELSENKFINWIKKKMLTIKNRATSTKMIDKVAKENKLIGWTIGHFLDGRYKSKKGVPFGENSLSVEIVGIDTDTLLKIATELCIEFTQESVLVKDYSSGNIFFVDGN